jgi:hypothetical protein
MNLDEKWYQILADLQMKAGKKLENAIDCDKLSIKYGLSISYFFLLS